MLETLKFVQGAVAKKDFVPVLMHFHIKNGIICGYNGRLALSSPIDLDLDCCPLAKPFVKAIQTCKDTIELHMTAAGRLSVKSGKFRAYVDCVQEVFPDIKPEGEIVELQSGFLDTFKLLAPFIAEDDSKQWARGILLRGQSAYATNNIILIEKWMGSPFPVEVNVPANAVAELLRIGEDPISLQMNENSLTFHYSSGRWLRSQLLSTQWPDVGAILSRESAQEPVPEGLWAGLQEIKPFVDDLGRVWIRPGKISTHLDEGIGASTEVPMTTVGCFNLEQLALLESVATSIDISAHPRPGLFYGDKLRGAIVGIRV